MYKHPNCICTLCFLSPKKRQKCFVLYAAKKKPLHDTKYFGIVGLKTFSSSFYFLINWKINFFSSQSHSNLLINFSVWTNCFATFLVYIQSWIRRFLFSYFKIFESIILNIRWYTYPLEWKSLNKGKMLCGKIIRKEGEKILKLSKRWTFSMFNEKKRVHAYKNIPNKI